MDEKKQILVFFDLEGTIIEEELGEINKEKIKEILNSLNRLEENTNAKVNIHIVSPVFIEQMKKVIDDLDRLIIRYNMANGKNLKEVQGAVAHPEVKYVQSEDFLHDKIIPMKLPTRIADGYKDKYGKFDYVRNWIEAMNDKVEFSIYAGNGFNDTKAMEYIKRSKNGFVICPENSHPDVKKISDYVSEKHAEDGIIDGIDYINQQIEKRKTDTTQKISDEENCESVNKLSKLIESQEINR